MVTKETKLSNQNETVSLSVVQKMLEAQAEQNREAMKELAKALRAPADLTPQQLAQAESDRQMREDTARLQRAKVEKTAADQKSCVHRRKDRSTHCVYEYAGQYLICQGCQGIIHPEPRPTGEAAKETSHHIYDTRMFNEHFTESQAGATTF
jgi:hypothetical protein